MRGYERTGAKNCWFSRPKDHGASPCSRYRRLLRARLYLNYFLAGCASPLAEKRLYGQVFLWDAVAAMLAAEEVGTGPAAAVASDPVFQSSGGLAIPQTLPWVYSDAPMRKCLPSLPKGRQLATHPVTVLLPGRSLRKIGVPICNDRELRKPHPCALTIITSHLSAKGRSRSKLVTVSGICTRTRVLRRATCGAVVTSMRTRGGFRGSRRGDSSLTDSRPAGFWETPDPCDEGNRMDYEEWSRERAISAISMSATTEVRRPAKRSISAEVAQRKAILAARLKP